MAPPGWLPPLNSHNQYNVFVRASQPGNAFDNPRATNRKIAVELTVDINFNSDDKNSQQRLFEGLSTESEFTIDCDEITTDPTSAWESVEDMLTETYTPFDFEGALWTGRQFGSRVESKTWLRDDIDLILKISEFLSCMNFRGINAGKNRLPFKLEIEKMVIVPDQELAAWNSWYDEKRRSNPNFDWDFLEAIGRPRTEEELIAENDFAGFKATTEEAIQELESVAVDDSASGNSDCPICLKGFSRVREAMKLPCSHIFHRDCIVKWLQDSHLCPLCRFPLPTD